MLVRGVNWIGDAIMTLPALHALKRSDPSARIALLVKPWVAPLFENDPHVDRIILYSAEYEGLSGKRRLAAELKKEGFCSAVLFQNAMGAALIAFLAGIPERIGYSRDGRRLLLTRAVRFDEHAKRLHHIDYYMNLLEKAGFSVKKSRPWIYLTLEERLKARRRLLGMKRPLVALNPGATYGSSKRWPPERFADVAARITSEMKGSVIICGGPSEAGICDEILAFLRPEPGADRVRALAGKTTLRELAALISESDLLISNDSGPMHIGYAVGTPVVAIFGSTSPEHTGPAGSGDRVIRKELACAPCFERECRRGDLKCMDLVSAAEVFRTAIDMVRKERAVFFDRDGTLCRDAHYLNSMERLEILPEVSRLADLKASGFRLVGVSNQSGIARGIVEEEFVKKVNDIFLREHGFDAFYYCPHHPEERCSCRKPEPGLLVDAGNDLGIDLRRSFVVGDKESDVLLARAAGAIGILITEDEAASAPEGVFKVGGLGQAVDLILDLAAEE